ncbi:hypothetical protein ACRYCC_43765 [Actinomadura scrupuli]|uniref:hypothetical protein n=1 Tax=Actinomadura scrupuli TaxID=559629 RepID=UPI003D992DF3
MNERSRATALMIAATAAALALSACGGGKDGAAQGGPSQGETQGQSASDGSPATGGAAPKAVGGPLPKVVPQQVKGLVGTWTNTAKGSVGDAFEFKADGTGSWKGRGRILWTGQVIPAGKDQYRLSWQGKDPNTPSFWSVKLTDNGRKLLFQGNQQTYSKTKSGTT